MRCLFVTARPPWPPRRGDQTRVAGLIAELGRRHELAVVALCPPGFAAAAPPEGVELREVRMGWPAALAAMTIHPGLPLQVGMHEIPALRRAVARAVADFRPDVAVVVLSRLGGVLPALAGIPVVLDLIDALSLNMANRAGRERVWGPLLRREARRMGDWDRSLLERVDAATVVAERDRAAIVAGRPDLTGKVEVVPIGVAVPATPPVSRATGPVVLLSGNLGYFPTVEGAVWFAREVWPLIRQRRRDAEWWLAGARPATAIRRLAGLEGVRLLDSPASLDPVRAAARVAIAPMRAGSGTPIKVLEALASGLPVVATPAAIEGLGGAPQGAVVTASTPADFAAAVVAILEEPAGGAASRAQDGWAWVRARHALPVVAAQFEAVLQRAVAARVDAPGPGSA